MSPFVLSNRFGGDRDAAASLDRPFNANFKRQEQDKTQCHGKLEKVEEELSHAEKGSFSAHPITLNNNQPGQEEEETMEKALDQVDLELGALIAIHNNVQEELELLSVNLYQAQIEVRWGETEDWATVANLKASLKKIKKRLQ